MDEHLPWDAFGCRSCRSNWLSDISPSSSYKVAAIHPLDKQNGVCFALLTLPSQHIKLGVFSNGLEGKNTFFNLERGFLKKKILTKFCANQCFCVQMQYFCFSNGFKQTLQKQVWYNGKNMWPKVTCQHRCVMWHLWHKLKGKKWQVKSWGWKRGDKLR